MSSSIPPADPKNINQISNSEPKAEAPKTKFSFSIKQVDSNKNLNKAMDQKSNVLENNNAFNMPSES
jgi:hypothetical protein